MTSPARWAVYAIPGIREADGPLAARLREFGTRALEFTTRAKRYGWHATLKAPFRSEHSEREITATVAAFAETQQTVVIRDLALRNLDGFWALVPGGDTSDTDALAAACVTELDSLRAPLDDTDLARRNLDRLTPAQHELLRQWGYPYVLDEFMWHFSLSDHHSDPTAHQVPDASEFIGQDIPLTSLALCVERTPGAPFEVHSIHPLSAEEQA